jgi:hypothetical protein
MRSLILLLIASSIFSMWCGNRIDNKVQRYPDLGFHLFFGGFLVVCGSAAVGVALWMFGV